MMATLTKAEQSTISKSGNDLHATTRKIQTSTRSSLENIHSFAGFNIPSGLISLTLKARA